MTEQMVEQALNRKTVGKAPGPSRVTSDLIKTAGVKELFQICESIEQESEFPEQ